MTDIQGVIFDLDGTLLDTETLADIAILDTLVPYLPNGFREKYKLLPWELKKQTLGLRGSDWIPLIFNYAVQYWNASLPAIDDDDAKEIDDGNKFCPELINEFWKKWEHRLGELCFDARPCPGAENLVEELARNGITMGIATSSRSDSVHKKRRNNEKLFKNIQVIVTGDDPHVPNGKPAPDIYIQAALRMGLNPKNCLVFEDSLTGCQSGRSAGCKVIAVPDVRMDKRLFVDEADVILTDLSHFDGKPYGLQLDGFLQI